MMDGDDGWARRVYVYAYKHAKGVMDGMLKYLSE